MSNVEWFAEQLNWGKYVPLALIGAGVHDIYSTVENRAEHHRLAYDWVLNNSGFLRDTFPEIIRREEDVLCVAFAALEHRSSYEYRTYYSPVSELVSAADRGIVTVEVGSYFDRSYLYARTSANKNVADSVIHSIEHIKEKFGHGMANNVAVPIWYKLLFQDVLYQRTKNILATNSSYFTTDKLHELECLCNR
ncbi:MAG: hypothetical protein ACRDBQ_18320 [Shewanella sp.]